MNSKHIFTVAFCMLCIWSATPAEAQQRISAQIDISRSEINAFNKTSVNQWRGFQIEYDQRFKNDKLKVFSGFALGVRHEPDELAYFGTYITARAFKTIDKGPFEIIISGGIVYGFLGNSHNHAWQETNGQDQLSRTRIFPLQNITIPFYPIEMAGVIYPEFTASIRYDLFGHLGFEPFVGARILKFQADHTDFVTTDIRRFHSIIPTAGLRLSFRF